MKLNFGENIRKLRIEHGLTQEELADFLGVSFQAVSKWERGDTVPDIYMLPTIAAFFGVTTDHLLCFDQVKMEKDIEKYESLYYELWQKNDRETLLEKMKDRLKFEHELQYIAICNALGKNFSKGYKYLKIKDKKFLVFYKNKNKKKKKNN